MIDSISVFCGSGLGSNGIYANEARKLGKLLAEKKIRLVYGGSKIGLMGEIARTVLHYGGEVTGVIPEDLVKKEVGFHDLTDLRIVGSMHQRKALIAEISDAFIALPGGFGTFEEIFEAITWYQLGIHQKPCAFLNVNGYFDTLFQFVDHAVDQNFIQHELKDFLLIERSPDKLLSGIQAFKPVRLNKAGWALSQ